MVLLAVIAYWNGLAEAVHRWGNQEEYSHGYLIPWLLPTFSGKNAM
ncbi:transmembrane protein EpsH [Methylophaga lonarensis MPL]|uniref:Transmembrane protein EpsH n=1 Tax=Methylophaga lonarensis MPL TaxID=1286106 RepID=M7P4B9_9GAMM|nr:transmembrane protein EpsH [Methylophaga lonarensis MPL]